MEALLLLVVFSSPLIMGGLVVHSFYCLFNSDDYKTSTHQQEINLELRLLEKLKREETNPLSIAALASPMTAPLFFVWGKDQSYALRFEENITIAVSQAEYEQAQENTLYPVKKITKRNFYHRKWYQSPLLLNLIVPHDLKLKGTYEETVVKHQLI